MFNRLKHRLEDIKSSIARLSPRERLMVGGLALTFLLGIVVLVSYLIQSSLDEMEENNQAIRQALRDLEEHKDAYTMQRKRLAALEVRMSRTPLELNRFVETAASAVGISISESGEIAPVTSGKYLQRGVEIKLQKVSIEQLSKFLKELEGSPQIVQITRLSVNTRWNQHQDLDVEMSISTFERKHAQTDSEGKKRPEKDRS